ncbi:protein phosphatase 2C domain-containing protein [Gammaproteobacteria bacterium]|nr:protein phosphatase 2C domain-containing protein [Gammaproteobacteria bacterium]
MEDNKTTYIGDYGATTDTGAVRKENEDTYLASPESGLWLVADGMGGHNCGDVASAITRNTVAERFAAGGKLAGAIQLAHHNILDESKIRRNSSQMGSTIVAVVVDGVDYEVAWVGDSRAYLWDGQLMQITQDHSYVRSLVDSGTITPEEALTHPSKHLLIRCLGIDDDGRPLQVEIRNGRFSRGQEILLCSDGLTGELGDEEIEKIIAEKASAQERADRLVKAAVDNGGKDNVTVILVSAPDCAPVTAGWKKNTGLVLGGAFLAVFLLGVAFFLKQQGLF